MISFVRGKLDSVTLSAAIVEVGGIGYEINVGVNTLSKLPNTGTEIKLHTYLQVKEDGMSLFGFLEKEELNMFNMLISVSGIGPKSAMNMLSQASAQDLMLAIISDDIAMMSKFQGIGKKTAGRLILELKDKIKTGDATNFDFGESSAAVQVSADNPKGEAVAALCALGYSRSEAVKATVSVYEDGMDTQQIIKLSLKAFNKL